MTSRPWSLWWDRWPDNVWKEERCRAAVQPCFYIQRVAWRIGVCMYTHTRFMMINEVLRMNFLAEPGGKQKGLVTEAATERVTV